MSMPSPRLAHVVYRTLAGFFGLGIRPPYPITRIPPVGAFALRVPFGCLLQRATTVFKQGTATGIQAPRYTCPWCG